MKFPSSFSFPLYFYWWPQNHAKGVASSKKPLRFFFFFILTSLVQTVHGLRLLFCWDLNRWNLLAIRYVFSGELLLHLSLKHQSALRVNISLVLFLSPAGAQASDKDLSGAFPGGLFPGRERRLGSWHHCCSGEAEDSCWWRDSQPARPVWIPAGEVTQHQSEVSLLCNTQVETQTLPQRSPHVKPCGAFVVSVCFCLCLWLIYVCLFSQSNPPSPPSLSLSSKVLDSMYDTHSGIKLTNHVEQGSTYSNCFSGQTFATFTTELTEQSEKRSF